MPPTPPPPFGRSPSPSKLGEDFHRLPFVDNPTYPHLRVTRANYAMAIVRTIFWVLLAVVLVLFAINNWQTVNVRIWNSLVLETKLPALVIGSFLLGLLPTWALYRAQRWRMKRRIAGLEATIARPNTIAPGVVTEPAPAPLEPTTPA